MTGTVYLSRVALERIEAAQAAVDEHTAHPFTGFCCSCGEASPCRKLHEASAVLLGYGRLPRRRAGVRRGGDIGRKNAGGFEWLG